MGNKPIKEIPLTDTNRHNSIFISTRSIVSSIDSEYGDSEMNNNDIYYNNPLKSARSSLNSSMSLGIRNSHKEKQIIFKSNKLKNHEFAVFDFKKKTNNDYEDANLIENCLLRHFFMRSLHKHARQEIIKEMSLVYVPINSTLFHQGMPGHYFYIIKQGSVELFINKVKVKELTVGHSFGELALLHGATRSGTVLAKTECLLWIMERRKFKKIVEHINKINFEENKTFIDSIPILAHLEHYQKTILASSLYKAVFDTGKIIVSKGEQSNCLYMIKEGEVDCIQNGITIRTLKRGDNFGERSILVDSTRTMDVVAKTNCVCFTISIETLKCLLGEQYRTLLYLNLAKNAIHHSKLFQKFNADLIEEVFDCFEAINLSNENVAYPIGHKKNSKIVIVIDGHLSDTKTKTIVANRGTILFEEELLYNSKEKTTFAIGPEPDCLFIEADTKQVLSIIGDSFANIIDKCVIIDSLSKVVIFKNLPQKKMESIARTIQIEKYNIKDVIFKEGDTGDKFYIVKSGSVNIYVKDVYMRTLHAQEYFGDRALLTKEPRSATVISNEESELYTLTKEDFLSNIEENMKNYLFDRLYLQDDTITLNDLIYHKLLGVGNYGEVSLVKCMKNNYFYAIKAISRKHINYEKLHNNLDLEKAILLQIDHPFIIKLVKCLKDENYIYFLMEYVNGKDLFDGIREIGLLTKETAQFFGASMILAIDYLHQRKFIYRDIKPENIVIKSTGFIKLIDFGTAKKITDRTATIIGTPHYMAPEVILGEGYSFQIDYWSIAVCIYEFICGGVPFGESAEDPMDVYLSIINDQLIFPTIVVDREFKRFIHHMLTKKPANRLTRYNNIQNDLWFRGFNWDNLITLNIIPHYIPKLKKNKTKDICIPYIKHMALHPVWGIDKELKLTEKHQIEYDNWYNGFV